MEEQAMAKLLQDCEAARRDPSLRGPSPDTKKRNEIFLVAHGLAEAAYIPAAHFFESCLTDLDSDWRLDGLRNLGFHYNLRDNAPLLEYIRYMLRNDPDPSIRSAAASILALHSQSPDWALEAALWDEPEENARRSVFESYLRLAGLSGQDFRKPIRAMEAGELEPTWENAQRLIEQVRTGAS